MTPSKIVVSLSLTQELVERADRAVAAGHANNRSALVEHALHAFLVSGIGSDRSPLDLSWPTYFELIRSLDGGTTQNDDGLYVFDVEGPSYRSEIEACRQALESAGSFAKLEGSSRNLVCGLRPESSGFFGTMQGAPFRNAIETEWPVIAAVLDALPVRGPVTAEAERACLAALLDVHGVAMAAATRWMALARPDLYFVVNGASVEGIERHLGRTWRETATRRVDAYFQLIAKVREFEWYRAPRPAPTADEAERFAWSARMALLDVVFYTKDLEL